MSTQSKPLQALFQSHLPVVFAPPVSASPRDRRTRRIGGLADFLGQVAPDTAYVPTKTMLQKQREAHLAKREAHERRLARELQAWRPHDDAKAIGRPYATLFVGQLRYTVDEAQLAAEFAKWGEIDSVRIVRDEQGRPRGYAFVAFRDERSARIARREAEFLLLQGRRIITDFERGRSSSAWRPQRLGGGIGGRNPPRPEPGARTEPPRGGAGRGGLAHRPYDRRQFDKGRHPGARDDGRDRERDRRPYDRPRSGTDRDGRRRDYSRPEDQPRGEDRSRGDERLARSDGAWADRDRDRNRDRHVTQRPPASRGGFKVDPRNDSRRGGPRGDARGGRTLRQY